MRLPLLAIVRGKWIWRLRSIGLQSVFYASRFRLGATELLKEEVAASRLIRAFVPITFMQVLLAVGTVVLLQVTDPYLRSSYAMLQWPTDVDNGLYGTLLGAIASIGGVFIGLYFAALTSVAAASYARYPSAVRNLLSAERVGGVYIRALAYITCLALLLLTMRVLGYPPVLIVIPTISVLGCIGVVAFVKLGQRVFSFFDPVQVSDFARSELSESLKIARAGGTRWFEPAFQQYAHRRTVHALDAISTLAEICREEAHLQDRSLLTLSRWISAFLIGYQKYKREIPSNSQWYEQIGQHRDIYRSDDLAIQMAHQTGTMPSGKIISNHWWIEERLFPILLSTLSFFLRQGWYQNAIEVASQIERTANALARAGDSRRAVELAADAAKRFVDSIGDRCEQAPLRDTSLSLRLVAVQAIARMPISILLSARLYALELANLDFNRVLGAASWRNRRSPYRLGLPRVALPMAEDLRRQLTYEFYVEGFIVSPLWYMREQLACAISPSYVDSVVASCGDIAGLIFETLDKKLADKELLWERAILLSSQLEYENKVAVHFATFSNVWDKLSEDRRIEGLEWPKFDKESIEVGFKARRGDLIRAFPNMAIALHQQQRPETIPDFAGQFLHESGEAILESLVDGNVELFRALFKPYFYGCLLTYDKLRPNETIPEHRLRGAVSQSLAPIADLLDISGYAYLCSELRGEKAYWAEVKSVWDKFLVGDAETSSARIAQLGGMLSLATDPMQVPSRGVLRTRWKMTLNQLIAEAVGVADRYASRYGRDRQINHPSPLVRVMAEGHGGIGCDGIDIFSDLYFADFQVSSERRHWRNLKERVSRESQRVVLRVTT